MSFIFGDKPRAPDPGQTAQAQQQYNTQAAQTQQRLNSYNQSNSFGAVNYVADPNSPSGYRIDTSLNPQSQNLLDTQRGTALNLAQNSAGMYSRPFDLQAAAGPTAGLLNQWQQQYLAPIFKQQDSNIEAQLRNQGLAPGSEAYNNAKNLLARNQGDVTNDYLTKNQGQAFSQALTQYGLPLQTLQGLEGTMPGNPTFAQTPTSSVQPANYAGLVSENYKNELANYENNANNMGKLLTAGAGLAMAPFTGGTSLMGAGLSFLGNQAGRAMAPSGGYTGWTGGWGGG